jgi:hypothetical protein
MQQREQEEVLCEYKVCYPSISAVPCYNKCQKVQHRQWEQQNMAVKVCQSVAFTILFLQSMLLKAANLAPDVMVGWP